jgi:hypothetical protein
MKQVLNYNLVTLKVYQKERCLKSQAKEDLTCTSAAPASLHFFLP